MNTFLYSYLVVMIIATIFLCYVHKAKIARSFRSVHKMLQELSKGAGYALRN